MELSTSQCRRSSRVPKRKIPSPTPAPSDVEKTVFKRQRVTKEKLYDVFPGTNQMFACDHCKSHWIIDPKRKKSKAKTQTKSTKPSPRYKFDEASGRTLVLCNSCGLKSNRSTLGRENGKQSLVPSDDEKERYRMESQEFVSKLKQIFHTQEAEKLVCPNLTWKICGCIQMYIMADSDCLTTCETKDRVNRLVKIHREAQQLSRLKYHQASQQFYNRVNFGRVGLGNGRKKCELYQDFVLEQREFLREHARFCEKAAQQILGYSNNLLYRRLKTKANQSRLTPKIGKGAKDLVEIENIACQVCCSNSCVMLAVKWPEMVRDWRQRALLGQMDCQMVISEMLTPVAGFHSNCIQFIAMVTGACLTTILKVATHLRQTGGDKQPPEHGLKKYHHELQIARCINHSDVHLDLQDTHRHQLLENHWHELHSENDQQGSNIDRRIQYTVSHYRSKDVLVQPTRPRISSPERLIDNLTSIVCLPTGENVTLQKIPCDGNVLRQMNNEKQQIGNCEQPIRSLHIPHGKEEIASRSSSNSRMTQETNQPVVSKYTSESIQAIIGTSFNKAPNVTISSSDLLQTLEIERENVLRMQLILKEEQASLKAKQRDLEKQMLEAVIVKGRKRSGKNL